MESFLFSTRLSFHIIFVVLMTEQEKSNYWSVKIICFIIEICGMLLFHSSKSTSNNKYADYTLVRMFEKLYIQGFGGLLFRY